MRLGVVGFVPGDPRAITIDHLNAVQAAGFTSANFHGPGDELENVTEADCDRLKSLYAETGLELAQFGVGYSECLFDPDAAVRDRVVRKIERGIEVGCSLDAHMTLIRTGSLNERGSYNPSRKNYEPGRFEQLVDTLRRIADKAETEGMTIVVETHLLTIMGSPEINVQVVDAVGSDRIRVVMDFVNHFQNLDQVYASTQRINHIFDVMGHIAPIGHFKDIKFSDGLVLHIDEEVPGEGELDLAVALRRWEDLNSNGYMLIEHLPDHRIPLAAANTRRIAAEAGIQIH